MQEDNPIPTYETQAADQTATQKPQLKYLLVILVLLAVAAVAVLVLSRSNENFNYFGLFQSKEELQTEEMNRAWELEAENATNFPEEEFVPYEELPIM